ncbi:SDR family NAD(P)-dependent oxidoreductase [Limibacter armeniacum]|uniref:SDR family NAD(P)-dependent oxidoreductase n=1 Tax=Limibacter armeniacum TaxID=466084 RepID=UPI002FE54406
MSKIALITGVSREMGLGFETARQLGKLGYKVIVTARELSKVKPLEDKLRSEGLDVLSEKVDITNEQRVAQLAQEIDDDFGKLDVLINNAGAFYDAGGDPLTVDFDFVKAALDVNLLGAWRMIAHFASILEKSENGIVVNVSSGAGAISDMSYGFLSGSADTPVYSVSKLALNGLTIKMAEHLKGKVKVNAVCPSWVATYPGTAELGARPVEEGAKGIVWAATLPEDGPTGGFFRDGKSIDW